MRMAALHLSRLKKVLKLSLPIARYRVRFPVSSPKVEVRVGLDRSFKRRYYKLR